METVNLTTNQLAERLKISQPQAAAFIKVLKEKNIAKEITPQKMGKGGTAAVYEVPTTITITI